MTMYHTHNLAKRRAVLTTASAYCSYRAWAYSTEPLRVQVSEEPLRIAAASNPTLFGLYLVAWAAAGIYCLWHLTDGHLLKPLSAVCGLTMIWGVSCLIGGAYNLASQYLAYAVTVGALVALTPTWPARMDDTRGDA